MLPCDKRQTVVKRNSEGETTLFRCLNKQCGMHGHEVDAGVCSRCPVRVVQHQRPCPQKTPPVPDNQQVTTQEFMDVSDAEVLQMIKDAGLDASEITDNTPNGEPQNFPPLSIQLWTYKEALIRWNKAGRPTRSQAEVERIHEKCCKPCEWYDKEKQRCKGCGCKVTIGSVAVFNKLKMATEKCPKGKF